MTGKAASTGYLPCFLHPRLTEKCWLPSCKALPCSQQAQCIFLTVCTSSWCRTGQRSQQSRPWGSPTPARAAAPPLAGSRAGPHRLKRHQGRAAAAPPAAAVTAPASPAALPARPAREGAAAAPDCGEARGPPSRPPALRRQHHRHRMATARPARAGRAPATVPAASRARGGPTRADAPGRGRAGPSRAGRAEPRWAQRGPGRGARMLGAAP